MTEQYFFHPDYDNRVHVDYAKLNAIGTAFVGPMGLLSRLELKLGLIHAEIPNEDCEREEQYKDAIKKSNPNSFANSFKLDEVNTTRQLLRWRDALKMADWDFKSNSSYSDVLNDIAAIEAKFAADTFVGIADRWIAVKNNIAKNPFAIDITVCCDKSQIHPTIADVLNKLKAKYISLSDEYKGKVTAYKFKDAYDAYKAAALTLDPQKDIIIAQNTKAFNDVLKTVVHSEIDASYDNGNTSVVQLFKITLLMFADPYNFRNIVSYLKTSPCPVMCGDKLGDYLLGNCGWGETAEWNNLISNVATYQKWDPVSNSFVAYSPNEVNEIQNGFNDFKAFVQGIGATTNGADIDNKISVLISWANKYHADPAIRSQKAMLRNLCRRLFILLDVNKDYTPDEIRTLVDNIEENATFTTGVSKVDSFFTYPSLGCIHDSVAGGKVVWVDCYGELSANYDYSFLSPSDVSSLQASGVGIWAKTDQVAAKISLLSASAKHAGKEVILFIPQNADGARTVASPLISELGIDMTKVRGYTLATSSNPIVPFASAPQTGYYNLKAAIPQRIHESYSSLNLLINYPFDYVLQYACSLYPPKICDFENLTPISGTVAHKAFENICKANSNNARMAQNAIARTGYLDAEIRNAAMQCGVVLLLPENSFLMNALYGDLQVAFTNLLDIIVTNNLDIVGNELEYKETSSSIINSNELTAKVDLVLKDKQGKIYIFDLKYGNPNTYKANLFNDKALQLDIYRYCVEHDTTGKKANVEMVGYFNLKVGRLFTVYSGLVSSNNVEVITPKSPLTNIMGMVKDSYDYRFNEFNTNHILEEGEGCSTSSLTYGTIAGLYPLKKKSSNRFSDFNLFKGGSK